MALRKMLGSADHPAIVHLMRLIETQSHMTLIRWAVEDVAAHMLPIVPEEPRLTVAIDAVRAYADGSGTLAAVKLAVKEARAAAQSLAKAPTRQAAARAIATACAVATTPTNALGFAFYSAAAYAYRTAGEAADAATHDALATQELQRLVASLETAAVADEPWPVEVNWGC